MRTMLYVSVLLAVIAAATAVSGGAAQPTRAKLGPIIVGFADARTGVEAAYDGPPDTAAMMAIKDINAHGGVLGRQLKAVSVDTKSQVDLGANAATAVINKGAKLLIVGCDFDFGSAATLVAERRGVLAFSTCASTAKFGPQALGRLAFTMGNSASTAGAILSEWTYQARKWRSAYILYDHELTYNKILCDGFKQRFKELGGVILGEDTVLSSDTSIGPQITRLRSLKKKPSFIFNCTSHPVSGLVWRQLRAAGIQTPIVAGEEIDGTFWLKTVPHASNLYGIAAKSMFLDDPDPKANAFFRRVKKVTGHPAVASFMVTGYSVIDAFARAAKIARSTDGKALAKALETFRNVPLLVGRTTFTSKYHISWERPMRILEVQNGKHRFLRLWSAKKVPSPGA